MTNILEKYIARYVVPFYFDYKDNGYARLVEFFRNCEMYDKSGLELPKDCQWVENGFWENSKDCKKAHPEMDIYAYLLHLLEEHPKDDNLHGTNLGTSFVLKTSGSLFDFQYIPKTEEEGIRVRCGDLGLLLFRNGIGFIWYNAEFDETPDIETYVNFQHDFKELARSHSKKFRKITGNDTYESFFLGKWLSRVLFTEEIGIRFWAERELYGNSNGSKVYVPDKALLFQYIFIGESENQERMDLAFRIANGYDIKYNVPGILKGETYEPFGNASFYASQMGMAYVVSNNETNATFFLNTFKSKFIGDYFFIYVLLLYQKYSSADYSRLLTKLPADEKSFEDDGMYLEFLETLDNQINLFLVKSVYGSVSNVQHQNGVYEYGKKRLCIEEDIRSLTVGLEGLRGIEREKQKRIEEEARRVAEKREQAARKAIEEKEKMRQEVADRKDRAINKGLTLFGFLVVISTAVDTINFVDWLVNEDKVISIWHIVALLVISSLTIFTLIVLIVNTRREK